MSESRTHEWRLPEAEKPPLIGELVERIDEAVAIARASEAAVMTVGAAALDAAEQAKRAADLAERASAAIGSSPADRSAARSPVPASSAPRQIGAAAPHGDLASFAARADRVAERLRRLEQTPLSA